MDCAKCFFAKKEKLFFYEGLWPIATSIKEGLSVLRSAFVLVRMIKSVILRHTVYLTFQTGDPSRTLRMFTGFWGFETFHILMVLSAALLTSWFSLTGLKSSAYILLG